MNIFRSAAFAVGVVLASAGAIHAEPSSELKQHVVTWLAGNDAESLKHIAQLASGGDSDAQLFLGQIDKVQVATGMSPYLRGLSYQDRAKLLRKETADGHVNWLFAKDDASLQKLFFAQRLYLESPDIIAEMSDLGEDSLAKNMLLTFMLRGRFDLVQTLSNRPELIQSGPVAWIGEQMSTGDRILNIAFIEQNNTPASVRGLLSYRSLARNLRLENRMANDLMAVVHVLEGNLEAAQEKSDLLSIDRGLKLLATSDASLGTLARFCATLDEGDPFCLAEALSVLGGYNRLANLRTPSDQIVPQAEYLGSERAQQDLMQMVSEGLNRHAGELRSAALSSLTQ